MAIGTSRPLAVATRPAIDSETVIATDSRMAEVTRNKNNGEAIDFDKHKAAAINNRVSGVGAVKQVAATRSTDSVTENKTARGQAGITGHKTVFSTD